MTTHNKCPQCESLLFVDEVLIEKSTSPHREDVFGEKIICENPTCDYCEEPSFSLTI